jgi:hypothetical protein
MMQQQEFIAKMAIAHMRHHGYTPSTSHLKDWADLWHATNHAAQLS